MQALSTSIGKGIFITKLENINYGSIALFVMLKDGKPDHYEILWEQGGDWNGFENDIRHDAETLSVYFDGWETTDLLNAIDAARALGNEEINEDLEYFTEWASDVDNTLKTHLEKIGKEIKENGFIEIKNGVYISSADYLISEQKEFDASDVRKNMDFNEEEFWVTDNYGLNPEGFCSIPESLEFVYKN